MATTRLTNLGFQLIAPSRRLRPYIRSYWCFSQTLPANSRQAEYMHPSGGYGIVFNFGDLLQLDTQPMNRLIFLDGANTVSRQMSFIGHIDLLGIRFYEGGAYPFLGIPLHTLRNESDLLDAVQSTELMPLYGRLYEAKTTAARIQLLEQWLNGRLTHGPARSPLIAPSITLLRHSAQPLTMRDIAQELAISQRQLERLYQSQVGISPKQYAQLIRVERARLAIKQATNQTMTRLGNDLGYFDQSHFIREFRAVIGMTPFAYAQRHQLK